MSRRRSSWNRTTSALGFTLIEALIALAIVAAALSAIGSVIATTVKSARGLDQRIAMTGVAESVLASLPSRAMMKPGRQTGETGGYRWRVETAPLSSGQNAGGWTPLSVNMVLQAPTGAISRITTVRLVRASAQ